MNSYKIYTRKIMGLDNRVWRFMLAMIFVPLCLLSYQVINKDETCSPFSFYIKNLSFHANNVYYTGDVLSFTVTIPSDEIDWDFGDGSRDAGRNVAHSFLKEGIYHVTASGNSLCPHAIDIKVENRPAVSQQGDPVRGRIVGLKSFNTFTTQKFTYPRAADSYKWTIQNHPVFVPETGQTVSFTFTSAGNYTIQVELDNDPKKRDYFDVTAIDEVKKNESRDKITELIQPLNPKSHPKEETPAAKPEIQNPQDPIPASPPPNKLVQTSNETFQLYLEKAQNKEMTMADFEKYGVYATTPVLANGKERQNFKWLCDELPKVKKTSLGLVRKKMKIESVNVQRINGLPSVIEISYKYK